MRNYLISLYWLNIPLAIIYVIILLLLFKNDITNGFYKIKHKDVENMNVEVMKKQEKNDINLKVKLDNNLEENNNFVDKVLNENDYSGEEIKKEDNNNYKFNGLKISNRKFSLDLLKIILFFMVVVLHIINPNIGEALKYATGYSEYVLRLIQSMSIVAVDCFVLITGYFMCKKSSFNIKKIVYIYIMYFSYNLITYGLDMIIFNNPFSLNILIGKFIPKSFFINFYCLLLFLAPLLNKYFKLKYKYQIIYLISFLGLFVILPTFKNIGLAIANLEQINGLSFVTINGEVNGYTIVIFILMYLIGGFIRNNEMIFKKTSIFIFIYFSCAISMTFISRKIDAIWNYDSILVVLGAISLFSIFNCINISRGRVLTIIANSSLGVYILHTSKFVIEDIYSLFKVQEYVNNSLLSSILFVLCVPLIIAISCSLFDIIVRFLILPIRRKTDKIKFFNDFINL